MIHQLILDIIKQFDSSNPAVIASQLNIITITEALGNLQGYYNSAYGVKFIHVNESLDELNALKVLSHELGHAILHTECNVAFLENSTLFNIDKMEHEANLFAVYLLVEHLGIEALPMLCNDLKVSKEEFFKGFKVQGSR